MRKNSVLRKFVFRLLAFVLSVTAIGEVLFYTLPLPGQIPILMYHFIGSEDDAEGSRNFVTLETFQKQMVFLKKMHYRVISLDEFSGIYNGQKKATGREVVLTFDDGNPSVFNLAWPILKRYGFPSTQFLISEGLKYGTYGSIAIDKLDKIQADPLITWAAHSRTHPFLSQLSDAELESEIAGSKSDLETELKVPIRYFAYPYGAFDDRALHEAEKAGFDLAFTTSPKKLNDARLGKYCLTRIKISESSENTFATIAGLPCRWNSATSSPVAVAEPGNQNTNA